MSTSTAEQRLLAARARLGDDSAFELLVHEHTRALVGFVRKLGLPESVSEDVVQETWVAAWKSLRTLRDVGKFRSWLFGITRNKALQHFATAREIPIADLDTPATDEVLDSYFDRFAPYLNRALDGLPVSQREVLALRFFEGMSYENLAETICVSEGTIKSRLHYAKAALRRRLEVLTDE